MNTRGRIVVKQVPERPTRRERGMFLGAVKQLVHESYRPQLVLDLSSWSEEIDADTIDLLLSCVEYLQRAEGRVSVTGASPQASVILELTQLTSVMDMFPSVAEATGSDLQDAFDSRRLTEKQPRAA